MQQPDSNAPKDSLFPYSDDWYRWKGVKPPTHEQHGLSEEDIRKIAAEQVKGHKCKWQQRGNTLHCDSGEFGHGMLIDVNKILVGQNGNAPILQDIVITKQ